ncbi:energy transducer TonB [Chitinophaga pollutisoli]|uniref:Energy transducer TonB n=1 Tax=Chitinophaga pollutisoli TaxID=3133966 RepID=A0ABZ2YUZ0_9BACT
MPKPDFLDILFNSRNKDYGAYDLRRKYDRRVRNAVAGMAGIVLLCIGAYTWASNSKAAENVVKPVIFEAPDMIEVPPEERKFTPPPPRAVEPPPQTASVKHVTVKVVEDDKVNPEDEMKTMDELKDVAISTKDIAGEPGGVDNPFESVPEGTRVIEVPEVKKKEDFPTFVEIMPEFPGGEKAMYAFLNDHMRYPHMASESGIEGTVFVKFVVNVDGSITNVETTGRKVGAGCEEEALRVIRKMPKWKAGRQNGRNVAVWFNVPIRFKLNQ